MNQRRKTPIMGWSSWNCFRTDITEEKLKQQAKALVDTGLAACGYEYFNMDDGFFGGRSADGRVLTRPDRFPNGIKCIADYAHSIGLKAGTYSDGGDKTCGFFYDNEGINGNGVGLYHHEERDLRTYLIEDGFDFIKVDWCGGLRLGLDEKEQYTKIGRIIEDIRTETGRDIVYNVCRWQFPGEWVTKIADSWRTGADIQPRFSSILQQIDNIKPLAVYCGPGHVNDLDMMQIGNGLSKEEEQTHFAMWCMLSTPLMIGCDLTRISADTVEMLKNSELIAINQDAACRQAFVTAQIKGSDGSSEGEIWLKNLGELHSPRKAVAFLNRSERELTFDISVRELGLTGEVLSVRDVLQHKDAEPTGEFHIQVAPHGIAVYIVAAQGWSEEKDVYRKDTPAFTPEKTLSDEEAHLLLKQGAVLLDVRDREEYENGHLEGAINIPYTGIHAEAAHLLPDREAVIIAYCRTGKRSNQARNSLLYLGYKHVYGWKAMAAGEPDNASYPGKE